MGRVANTLLTFFCLMFKAPIFQIWSKKPTSIRLKKDVCVAFLRRRLFCNNLHYLTMTETLQIFIFVTYALTARNRQVGILFGKCYEHTYRRGRAKIWRLPEAGTSKADLMVASQREGLIEPHLALPYITIPRLLRSCCPNLKAGSHSRNSFSPEFAKVLRNVRCHHASDIGQ